MDFIIVCPHCDANVGVDESTYYDLEFYLHNGRFSVNGLLECPTCGRTSVLDVELEPVAYGTRDLEE